MGSNFASWADMDLTAWQWMLLAVGAFCTGLSKTGFAGLGILTVALFANALPPLSSTGALLPLLLCADVFGVAFFRKHASAAHLWKLCPWVLPGIVAGYLALGRVNDLEVKRMIGGILLALVVLHLWRKRQGENLAAKVPHTWWFAALTGLVAGFTTMVANAAGPIMVLYLLATGLPKLNLVGTGAWFFLLVNAIKVPFSQQLGLINGQSLEMDAWLLIPMLPGALLGPVVLRKLNQATFEGMMLALTVLASMRLLW